MKKFQKFAVVRINNDQLLVNENQEYEIKKISGKAGESVNLDVLLTAEDTKVQVGKPVVKNALVKVEIVAQQKGKKVTTATSYKPLVQFLPHFLNLRTLWILNSLFGKDLS